jgi:hypothetical protein
LQCRADTLCQAYHETANETAAHLNKTAFHNGLPLTYTI